MPQSLNTGFDPASQELLEALAAHLPDYVHGEARHDEAIGNGERTFASYRWTNLGDIRRSDEMACHLRLQLILPEETLWIGLLEIRSQFRRQGLGNSIVRSIELAARASEFRKIRLFSRYRVRLFWQKLGYQNDSGDRFYNKMLAEDI